MLHMTSFFQDLFLKVCDEILLGKEEIPQNSHMFALFDFPQMGYLMIPVVATPFLEDWNCHPSNPALRISESRDVLMKTGRKSFP